MKRFRFRLQRVLDAKETEERQRQRDLGFAQAELTRQQAALLDLEQQLAEEEAVQREMVKRPVRAGDALMQHRWHRELRSRIRMQAEQVQKAAEKVEEARRILVEASKERRVLERLKERRLDEYRKAELTQMQNHLDDVGSRRSTPGNQSPTDRT